MVVDTHSVGKQIGLEIWRIHKFDLEPVPKEQYGVFYIGDSYIVLNTRTLDEWDLHFWLGKDSSTDEVGTAAIKAVEIDTALGGFPTQYRETQNNESPLFMSYFKNGIRYLSGGHASSFVHVEDMLANFTPQLFQCKGKRNVRCTQVACKKESLNRGDVFILDLGRDLYVWMPPESGRLERISGVERAKNIAEHERHGHAKVHLLDNEWKNDATFWKHFGGKDVIASIAKGANDDENYWANNKEQVSLWRVNDSSGEAKVVKLAVGNEVTRNKLDPKDAFVLDACSGGIFVWIGRECTMTERGKAMHWGQTYLNQQKRPQYTQITRVLETAEPDMFIQWFSEWSNEKKKKQFQPKLYHVCDASGKLICEEIANYAQESLDGDDVMILDALHTIYVWVGSNATPNEKKQATDKAKKFLELSKLPRKQKTEITTIYEDQETPTFKKYFNKWTENQNKKDERSLADKRKLLFT